MANKDIVVIGASTGGIEALRTLAGELPKDYQGSILVVNHTGPSSPNLLDRILTRAGPLPAVNARNWDEIKPGHIYIAPADYHLLLERSGYVRISRGPKENRFRPAIDPLFRSAAVAYGPRVVGVVLTGFLDDGTAGLWAVKQAGGTAIVQHPEDAVAPSMPMNALKHVEVDYCVPLEKIAPLLVQLSNTAVLPKGVKPMPKHIEAEVKIAREDNAISSGVMEWGDPSVFACPECHGVLMELKEGNNLRFRCHTGHAYSLETLLAGFNEQTEETLWNNVRSLEETVLLLRRMAAHLRSHHHGEAAEAVERKAEQAHKQSELVRAIILDQGKDQKDREGNYTTESTSSDAAVAPGNIGGTSVPAQLKGSG
jgi:two-component system chemotaxis response regulator CheB